MKRDNVCGVNPMNLLITDNAGAEANIMYGTEDDEEEGNV